MLPLLVLACVTPDPPHLTIVSIADGEVVRVGTPVALEAEVFAPDGVAVETVAVEWTAGDWSGTGNPVHLDEGLPYGDHLVVATAEVDGAEVGDAATLAVRQLFEEIALEGLLTMDIHLWSTEYGDFDFVCEHDDLGFTITPEGEMVGQGACTSPLGQEVFTLEGALDVDAVSGTLTTTSEETDESMAFDGTFDEAMHVSATYDETFFTPDKLGSLRLYGGFEADPVLEE